MGRRKETTPHREEGYKTIVQNLDLVVYGIVFDSVQGFGSKVCETMWLHLLLNVPFNPNMPAIGVE